MSIKSYRTQQNSKFFLTDAVALMVGLVFTAPEEARIVPQDHQQNFVDMELVFHKQLELAINVYVIKDGLRMVPTRLVL